MHGIWEPKVKAIKRKEKKIVKCHSWILESIRSSVFPFFDQKLNNIQLKSSYWVKNLSLEMFKERWSPNNQFYKKNCLIDYRCLNYFFKIASRYRAFKNFFKVAHTAWKMSNQKVFSVLNLHILSAVTRNC